MKKLFLLLSLAANICIAQQIIVGDPAEPCGPPRPDYWIGRARTPLRNGAGQGRGQTQRQLQKTFTAAALDSYAFGANVRVNDNPPGTSFETPYSSGGHSIAVRGDTVYLVWRSDRNTNSAIYFDKSTDGGQTWGADVKVNDGDSAAIMPALALGKDGTMYVSWTDFRDITRHIYFAKSTNGGTSFTPAVRVQTATEEKQQYSSIAVNDSGYIFIAYEDFRNLATTAIDIYCSRSTDGGSSFDTAVRVDDCTDSINQWYPCLTNQDSNVYVVWEDFRDTSIAGQRNIYFALSNNNGISFKNNKLINDTVCYSSYSTGNPSIIGDNKNNVYIAWYDNRTPGDIYFTKSTDNGQTFIKPDKNLIDAAGLFYAQGYPSLACDDSGGVYCAWEDKRNGEQIYFGFSKNYGDSFGNNKHVDDRPNEDSAWLWTPTICANKKGYVYIAWMDSRNNPSVVGCYDVYFTPGNFIDPEGQNTTGSARG